MAFGGITDDTHDRPLVEINTTPLVDVMLVLLIIFMITAPLLTHSIRIDLPRAPASPVTEKPETVSLAIDAAGRFFWNDEPLNRAALSARMQALAQRQPQPTLHLRADRETRYQVLADVMAEAHRTGIARIAFVTDPREIK